MNPAQDSAFLTRLAQDTAGTTLAIATASIFALMGVVGGAVDISRSYMAQSRLQQACDAGALIARKSMAGETLTDSEKAEGYRYFDFNFPAGTYGVTITSRAYSQPVNSSGTPQAIVNGSVVASVPTTIMKIFGEDTVALNVTCSSKMDITNADVAMVLDVTGSMTTDMKISATGTATEDRIAALRRAVKAFYDALGPGRAAGDLSKGRIRYAFIPYGTVVNVGHLLTHGQMVDSWNYVSREAKNTTQYGYTLGSTNSPSNPSGWSGVPAAYFATAPYNNTYSVVSGGNDDTYTMHDGTNRKKKATKTLANVDITSESQCLGLNINGPFVGIQQTIENSSDYSSWSYTPTDNNPPIYVGPGNPNVQHLDGSRTRDVEVTYGYKYRWHKNGGSTNGCWLERASKKTSGTPDEDYVQTQTGSTTRSITWTTYTGVQMVYGMRSITVSGLKNGSTAWNTSLSIPALNRTGNTTTYSNVYLSGKTTAGDLVLGGTAQNETVNWRGCVEERQMDPTITDSTSINSVPTNAYDLRSTLVANSGDNATRWRPWLWRAVYAPNGTKPLNEDNDTNTDDDQCPPPAIRLQEIGNYNTTLLSTPYPNLFEPTAASPDSFYYPYTSSQWGTSSTPAAERTRNSATLRNYIDRVKLFDGTLHDSGFIWGLHFVSGEGMFASDNPDRFNGQLVSRHIVFMTDGEMNPGEERYVFSGYNQQDGRLAPTSTNDNQMKTIENRRLRILCEAAKAQGITVWVVAITSSSTDNYTDLRACASPGKFKSAATSNELISSFTNIAQSIGGLRISQ